MTIRTRLLVPAILAGLTVIPAAAQTREAPGRFTMQPVEGGFLRLDTQTGAVSLCRPGTGNLVVCQPAQEEQGLAQEIARLRAENLELKAEVKRLKETAGLTSPDTERPGKEKFQLPSEEDVDSALDYLERMFKKFRDRLRRLDEDGGKKPGTPL
ncbi:MAG: hypothetical protein ACK4TL_13475 [Hyphomicrobiaceae bacterium]